MHLLFSFKGLITGELLLQKHLESGPGGFTHATGAAGLMPFSAFNTTTGMVQGMGHFVLSFARNKLELYEYVGGYYRESKLKERMGCVRFSTMVL